MKSLVHLKGQTSVLGSPRVSVLRPVAWEALVLAPCIEERLDGGRYAEGDAAALVAVRMLWAASDQWEEC